MKMNVGRSCISAQTTMCGLREKISAVDEFLGGRVICSPPFHKYRYSTFFISNKSRFM